MTIAERIGEREKQNEERINKEIDSCKMAYKVKDSEGNIFCFGGIAPGGFPWYRGIGGSKHIFDLTGYEVLEQHIKL
ncbi:MAG TPA: hypothetical protein PKK07_03380 [bacterium]|nr:hypothetical protein [bacterium]